MCVLAPPPFCCCCCICNIFKGFVCWKLACRTSVAIHSENVHPAASQPARQPAKPAGSQPFAWQVESENWTKLSTGNEGGGRKGVSGCSVSCRLPRSLGCLSTLWAEECNSIEQQYRIELKKACHNSELAICDLHKNKLYVQQINYMCCVCIIWNTHELYGILLPFRSI